MSSTAYFERLYDRRLEEETGVVVLPEFDCPQCNTSNTLGKQFRQGRKVVRTICFHCYMLGRAEGQRRA